jgi:uncharacterized DUF497 family protein
MSVDISFHRVTKITLGEVRSNESASRSYDVRDITITHDDGQQTMITLFSVDNEEDALRVIV